MLLCVCCQSIRLSHFGSAKVTFSKQAHDRRNFFLFDRTDTLLHKMVKLCCVLHARELLPYEEFFVFSKMLGSCLKK